MNSYATMNTFHELFRKILLFRLGELYIPATQRPNGTWRKAIRVKEGYIPPEEIPVYQNKGARFRKEQETSLPPGLHLETTNTNETKTKKSKKKKKQQDESSKFPPNETKKANTEKSKTDVGAEGTPHVNGDEKKLRNLKKKLKQTEELEEKIKSGTLANPDPDQVKKVERKKDLLKEINELENLLKIAL